MVFFDGMVLKISNYYRAYRFSWGDGEDLQEITVGEASFSNGFYVLYDLTSGGKGSLQRRTMSFCLERKFFGRGLKLSVNGASPENIQRCFNLLSGGVRRMKYDADFRKIERIPKLDDVMEDIVILFGERARKK